MLEIIRALATVHDASWEQLGALREKKAKAHGGFRERMYLIDVDDNFTLWPIYLLRLIDCGRRWYIASIDYALHAPYNLQKLTDPKEDNLRFYKLGVTTKAR